MTRLATFALAALACAGAAGSAQASSFSPRHTGFFANGTVTLGNQQTNTKCEVSLKGQVNKKGVAKIDSLVLNGNSACAGTRANGLPWKTLASGLTLGKIVGFAFSGTFLGACGPGTVPFTDNSGGMWTLAGTLPSGCTVNGTVNTTPPIVIVSP
ncbi:MAG: hypothetical protein ACR2F8_02260 [Caulobacteraceae bacterium]